MILILFATILLSFSAGFVAGVWWASRDNGPYIYTALGPSGGTVCDE